MQNVCECHLHWIVADNKDYAKNSASKHSQDVSLGGHGYRLQFHLWEISLTAKIVNASTNEISTPDS